MSKPHLTKTILDRLGCMYKENEPILSVVSAILAPPESESFLVAGSLFSLRGALPKAIELFIFARYPDICIMAPFFSVLIRHCLQMWCLGGVQELILLPRRVWGVQEGTQAPYLVLTPTKTFCHTCRHLPKLFIWLFRSSEAL